MTRDMYQLINDLRTGSSTARYQAARQLVHYDHKDVAKAIVVVFMEDDEPERRAVIAPLIERLRSKSMLQSAESAFELLQVGYLCIPYLDEILIVDSDNKLVRKVKQEIKTLVEALASMHIGDDEAVSGDDLVPHLHEVMIQATRLRIAAEKDIDQVDEKKLEAFLEINADAWLTAWRELLMFGRNSQEFFMKMLKEGDVQTRRVAARLLSAFHDRPAATALIGALNDNDVFVRDEAALVLSLFDDAEVASQLAGMYVLNKSDVSG